MYVAIIEEGSVEGAISQKVKLLICRSTPEAIACLVFELSKSNMSVAIAFLMDFKSVYYNKMHTEMKQRVWWVQSLEK